MVVGCGIEPQSFPSQGKILSIKLPDNMVGMVGVAPTVQLAPLRIYSPLSPSTRIHAHLVAQLGFEPRIKGYEPSVMPLHYRTIFNWYSHGELNSGPFPEKELS